jgi:hypothetical protein
MNQVRFKTRFSASVAFYSNRQDNCTSMTTFVLITNVVKNSYYGAIDKCALNYCFCALKRAHRWRRPDFHLIIMCHGCQARGQLFPHELKSMDTEGEFNPSKGRTLNQKT